MANPEHVAILRQGVEAWNQWRRGNRGVRPDLTGVKLVGATLRNANLSSADLLRADVRGVDFFDADLRGTNFSGADLLRADLCGAYFRGTDLWGANFHQATVGWTTFANVDLRGIVRLDTVRHIGPSTIGLDTMELSRGYIPESFLHGCGVSDRLIESTPSHTLQSIQYRSCFISYSSTDEALAQRLYADLQAAGVRCWYAPEDLKIGESILGGIDQGIRLHDKLLLLSESSVQSTWVETEVKLALERERNERRRVLFPVRIDDAVLTSRAAWAALIRADHHIGDFCQWKEHDSYQAVFTRLLRDLKATPDR